MIVQCLIKVLTITQVIITKSMVQIFWSIIILSSNKISQIIAMNTIQQVQLPHSLSIAKKIKKIKFKALERIEY